MSRLTITLKYEARAEAKAALTRRKLLTQEAAQDFMGPVFEGYTTWDITNGFVRVRVYASATDIPNRYQPKAEYYYPQQDIARLKWEQHVA